MLPPGHSRRAALLGAALVLVANALFYGHVVTFELVTGDDRELMAGSPLVTDWAHAPLRERLLTPRFTYAIPVTVASWAADWALWSGQPRGLHLTSLLIHGACALLVLAVGLRLGSLGPALVASLLFLLHPVQAEAVAFVAQRKDLLAGLFALLALLGLLGLPGARRPWLRLGLITTSLVLATLSKPTALLLGPALAMAVWLAPGLLPRSMNRGLAAVLLAAPAIGLGVLQARVHAMVPETADLRPMDLAERLALLSYTLLHYLRSIAFPLDLTPKVPRPVLLPSFGPLVLSLAVVVAFGVATALAVRRRAERPLLLLLWASAAYAMVSNLVPVRRFAADSYLYLVLPAVALAAALGLEQLRRRWPRQGRALVVGALALVLLQGVLAQRQAALWRDEDTLYGFLYRRFPENTDAVKDYTQHLARTGRVAEARSVLGDFYRRALIARPDSMPARHRLLRIRLEEGRPDEARRLLESAPAALRARTSYWEAWLELGMRGGDLPLAREAARRIVALDPRSPRKELLRELERATPPGAP